VAAVIRKIGVERTWSHGQPELGRGCGWGHAASVVKKDLDSAACKILVIDDEGDFRQVIIRFLSKQGFTVVAASDGKAGVGLAGEVLPDLIVCDLNMPGMDGYAVLAALRREPKLADIPLIFLTGQSQPSQVRHGMSLGADDYLTKPVNLDDLLSAVKVRLSRRRAQRQRQEKQMERAMQLFGGIVHDLRDPLFVVLGYTDLLLGGKGNPEDGEERRKDILDRMQQAVLRMQAIIAETLFLARSRMQRLPFDPGPLDLRDFCEQLITDHEESRRLQFQGDAGRFPVTADALRLRQALDNLLSNALKYSEGTVEVRLSASPQHYHIEVRDQGIGIPAEEQAGIFEPFFRASNTGHRPGHGLGLSLVKSCIEQHGGSVRFASDCGKGATFFVELPKSPQARTEPPARVLGGPGRLEASATLSTTVVKGKDDLMVQAPRRQPEVRAARTLGTQRGANAQSPGVPGQHAGRLRGIIVDDDPLVRSVMRDLLDASSEVLIVGEAGTLAQARLLAKQHGPQVVFLDVNLPDASGFDLLPELKPGAVVVFVTSAEEYAVHAFDCEAADFLLKPVSAERLKQALMRVRQRLMARPVAAAALSSRLSDSFLIKTLTEKRLVKVSEIERIIAYGEYSWVYWQKNKKGALLRKSLKQWLSELPGDQFIRVHRRAIVNLACMERIEKLPNSRMQIHLRDTAQPILVSLRLAPMLNLKLKSLRG
jgi:two-component system, sensor histidine kinase and response regulator